MLSFFIDILEITVGTSLLVLMMLLILRLVGKKFTAKCRYILWTLVLVRLAVPFSFNILPALIEVPVEPTIIIKQEAPGIDIDTPPMEFEPAETNPVQTPIEPVTPIVPTVPTTPTTPTIPTTPNHGTTTTPNEQSQTPPEPVFIPTETPDPVHEKEPITWRQILDIVSIVYVAGAVVFILWNLLSYALYTRKILRAARMPDERTLAIYNSICKKENLEKAPMLLISPVINSPAAFGIFRRKIVLPDISFTQNGLAGTLLHEVTHCKRGDLYIKVVELIARSFHWFNPLAHIAAVRCEMEMEMSCDETVLTGCGDDARAAYGEVMLDIIRRCRRNRGALTTHFNPKKSSVKARFANIIYGSGKRRGRILILICLMLCVIAGTIVACTVKETPEVEAERYKINVLVDEKINDGAHNRDIHIIEVEVDSEHEEEINETISHYFLDKYNEYMNEDGREWNYQLIDTTYSVQGNILGITGLSRFRAISFPYCYVSQVFYDLENDRLCTVEDYIEAAGLDMAKAEGQILKALSTDAYFDTLEWEILSVVYPDEEPVLMVKVLETTMQAEQPETIRLIGYNSDRYVPVNNDSYFDGFDEIEWIDIPIQLSIAYPDYESTPIIEGTNVINATSDGVSFLVAITSNVDVKNVKITKLLTTDLKVKDCVPLHIVDIKAGEPIYVEVSVPGTMGACGITYTDTNGTVRRYEITTSGDDGTPMLIEITSSRLHRYFKGSDLLAGEVEEYKLLIKDESRKASLYYYYNGIASDFASKFRISANGYEADITTSCPAWLRNTWEPQIYRSDITTDGGDHVIVIFTTGTGTGVHTEEAYVMNCPDGVVYALPNPHETVENIVYRNNEGEVWTVNSFGEKIDLPDNAYFDQHFSFYIENGKLYAKVLIGYDMLQYREDYFLIEYGYNKGGKVIVTSVKHSSELKGSDSGSSDLAVLPQDFYEIYHTAEFFYAIFTGYGRLEFYDEEIKHAGQSYRRCGHVEFFNLAEMRNVIIRHFSEEITNTLMNKTVGGIGCPLYIEQDGKMYVFEGYAAQWGYNSATGYTFEPLGYYDGEYQVRVSASIYEYGVKYIAGDICKYVVEPDGSIRFTQFPLMIECLWDAFADDETLSENPSDYDPLDVAVLVAEVLDAYRNGTDPNELFPASQTEYTPYPLETIRDNPDADEIGEILENSTPDEDKVINLHIDLGDGWAMALPMEFGQFGESWQGYFTGVYFTREEAEVNDEQQTLQALQSILESKSTFCLAYSKENLFLSNYVDETEHSIKKYTILDLNGDGDPEMVLWLGYYTNNYAGFLVLHRERDVVYAYGLPYRGFNGLKTDGTHISSNSADNHAICKLEFDGDQYTQIKLAYREGSVSDNELSYYIGDKSVSSEEFDAYEEARNQKRDALWIEYTGGLTNVDTTMLPAKKYYVPYNGDVEKQQSLMVVGVYGESHGFAFGSNGVWNGEIWAWEDGVTYYVFATHSPFEPEDKRFSDFQTYRVTTENGNIISVEKVITFTKEMVLEYGKPYSGNLNGKYHCQSYGADGLESITITIDNDKMTASSYLSGTDAGGTYEGSFSYALEMDGALHAQLSYKYLGDSGKMVSTDPKSFYGKLYEYGGFVHFISESSPESPVPMTFAVSPDSTRVEFVTFTIDLFGTGYSYNISVPSNWYLYNGMFMVSDEAGRVGVYNNQTRASLTKTEMTLNELITQLSNSEEGEYVFDGIEGSTYSGMHFWGCYGDEEMPKGVNSRRWIFYYDSEIGPYVLEMWQRLDFDSLYFANNVVYQVAESISFGEGSELVSKTGAVVEIYERYGLKVRVPYFYEAEAGMSYRLRAVTYIHPNKLAESEIASFYQTYMMDKGLGHLYSIVRHTAADMSNYKSDSSEVEYFAHDDTYFYGILRPTDVQWDTANESIKAEYERLSHDIGDVINLFLDANDSLTPCDHEAAVSGALFDR